MTKIELEAFHSFAAGKLSNGGAKLSIEDCLALWRQEQAEEEDLASIRRGLADIEAGRYHTLEEVRELLRAELGY